MIATLSPKPKVFYPVRDGKPMAETDFHAIEMAALCFALQDFFASDGNVYAAMNNFGYYVEGKPKKCFSPDVYVVKGVSNEKRDCYQVWAEGGRVPTVVFEFTSRSSKKADLGRKKDLCEQLGVAEYFLFDPKGEYLSPVLRGFQLKQGKYAEVVPDQNGDLFSSELQLILSARTPGMLRMIDPRTGKPLLRQREQRDALKKAESATRREAVARRAAEIACHHEWVARNRDRPPKPKSHARRTLAAPPKPKSRG